MTALEMPLTHILPTQYKVKDTPLCSPEARRNGRLITTAQIQDTLARLDEAREYLGTALPLADAFRLVRSTVAELIALDGIAIYASNDARRDLKVLRADIADTEALHELVHAAFASRQPVSWGQDIAAPLYRGDAPFGVMLLRSKSDLTDTTVVEAIAQRAGALVLSAMAAERTRISASVDLLTQLPNERALFVQVEKLSAAAIPFAMVLAELNTFDDLDASPYVSTDERVLASALLSLKTAIREKDQIGRTTEGEIMLLMLNISHTEIQQVLERLGRTCDRPVAKADVVPAKLDFGWAICDEDGNTPHQLIANARFRLMQQRAGGAEAKVLTFQRKFEK